MSQLSEAKFNALKNKLRELFELDKSDLDFGIYRIMAAKNKEITAFLDRHLKETVRQVLSSHSAGKAQQLELEIEEARQAAIKAGFDPDQSPKVKELKDQYDQLGGGSSADLEADIYNHLLNFFSRYYDEGDFISKRYYKGDTYAIPYNGEEVALHWANKDQYYIKSGEWHKDYRFRIGDRAVHFKLVAATQETGNNKEPDEAKRRYILSLDQPIIATDQVLTLNFEFRAPNEADFKRLETSQPTTIFGGKYAAASGRTKGDEREQFCADAEQRALAAMPEEWRTKVTTLSSTEAKPLRTVLGKQLDHFTAKNAFDYFIHKDLGGFLGRELDFYIKNEVVRIDDLESLSREHLIQLQGKVSAVRKVSKHIIEFLANVENFQKKLWLKRKFVLNNNWIVTTDLIPVNCLTEVATIPEVWDQLESLGIKSDQQSIPLWGTADFLQCFAKLPVDTSILPADLTRKIMSSIQLQATAQRGLLINGDNYSALRLVQRTFQQRVRCAYIDPPYNTGDDGFPYKDGYMRSSWYTMILQSLETCRGLLEPAGLFFLQIGDEEAAFSRVALESVFPDRKNSATTRRGVKNVQAQFEDIERLNQGYDLVHVCATKPNVRLPHLFQQLDEGRPGKWDTFWRGVDRPTMRYELFGQTPTTGQWRWERNRAQKAVKNLEYFIKHEESRKTLDEWYAENLQIGIDLDFVRLAVSEDKSKEVVQYYVPPQNFRLVSDNWLDIPASGTYTDFAHEKGLLLLNRIVSWNCRGEGVVLDYFAGSGTTAHSVIDLNRRDNGSRQFILVEMASYFETHLKKRLLRQILSPSWQDDKPTESAASITAIVQQFALESYDDSLNNLPSTDNALFNTLDEGTKNSIITYALDLELGPHLLNMDAFKDPWGYKIYAQLAGEDEVKLQDVDMVETFNYLLGLKVQAYGPLERYSAEFERLKHAEDEAGDTNADDRRMGKLRVSGRLRRDAEGPYVFQRVEGELNDDNSTRVLVIWRKLTENPEQDAAVLDAWMARHREETTERSEHRDYHQIYINGPVTLAQPTQEIRTVFPIEQTFKDRMFEDTE